MVHAVHGPRSSVLPLGLLHQQAATLGRSSTAAQAVPGCNRGESAPDRCGSRGIGSGRQETLGFGLQMQYGLHKAPGLGPSDLSTGGPCPLQPGGAQVLLLLNGDEDVCSRLTHIMKWLRFLEIYLVMPVYLSNVLVSF